MKLVELRSGHVIRSADKIKTARAITLGRKHKPLLRLGAKTMLPILSERLHGGKLFFLSGLKRKRNRKLPMPDITESLKAICLENAQRYYDELIEQKMEEFKPLEAESPIENILAAALNLAGWDYFKETDIQIFHSPPAWTENEILDLCTQHKIMIFRQYPIAKYKADFAVFYGTEYGSGRFAVECDGHDFHERNKFQAAYDKKRDRDFQALDWKVFRFTGSEVYNDPIHVASQIVDLVINATDKIVDGAACE